MSEPNTQNVRSERPRRGLVSAKVPSERFSSDQAASIRGMNVSEDEADAILQGFTEEDTFSKKTLSRMFVENVLMKNEWYYPKRTTPNPPSLSKAWAYYEHVTLPRHFVGDSHSTTVLRRCEPGEHENDTELYPLFSTPQSSLIEWGTGVDLYFISLRFFAAIMLIAGFINVAIIHFYNSEEYRGDTQLDRESLLMRGSAICTNTRWVVCTNCDGDDWKPDPQRFATAVNGTGDQHNLVLRNFCPGGELNSGLTNFATLVFLLITVGTFSYYLKLREIRFDEDKVTTTDYSVAITNPPPDALDIDEWKDFFEQFSDDQVTAITIALNNEVLVHKLITRRIFRDRLRVLLPKGVDLDDDDAVRVATDLYFREQEEQPVGCIGKLLECSVFPILRIFNMFLEPDVLVDKIATLTKEIKDLQNEKYDATEVFVTFETEKGQRAALAALVSSKVNLMTNNTEALAPGAVFQDRVLEVTEPPEPNAVRWLDLSATMMRRLVTRLLTLALTVGLVALASLTISQARTAAGPFLSGPLTTIWNSIIPQFIKILMIVERHPDEGGSQASLYLKITIFRWMLSAILVQVITPFTSTLGDQNTDLIPTIYAILLSDVWLSPLLRLIDISTNIKKHVFAPRSKTQEAMNMNFQGTFYNLGERYTDFTKVLFVCFFYSALFPAAFFFGFFILTFQYIVDKYCLTRIWGWTPSIGSQLAELSRKYFFSGALLAFALASAYAFVQFPYDNLCEASQPMTGFSGAYTNVRDLDNNVVKTGSVFVEEDTNFLFCSQSWQDFKGFSFPPTPRLQQDGSSWRTDLDEDDLRWMTSSQETLTSIYGWSAVVFVIIFIVASFGRRTYTSFVSLFVGVYEPEGSSQFIDFSSNPEIYAYVPQIKRVGFPFPFLVCDVDDIDQGLIGWNDPARSYDHYNVIFDVPHRSLRRKERISVNTRNLTTIAEHEDYREATGIITASGEEPTKVEVENNLQSRSQSQYRPIYSLIRHYPTKWQIELSKKDQ